MIPRLISSVTCAPKWGRQMRFLAGPRQSGKTTLAKSFLASEGDGSFYFNWDERDIKTEHNRGIDLLKKKLLEERGRKKLRWACFDEIHKMPKWKDVLKSYFDAYEDRVRLIVTGSARLDWFRRSGDSLAGRYFLFHLFPLNLFELTQKRNSTLKPHASAERFIEERLSNTQASHQTSLETLLAYSGFPEPFLKASSAFLRLWQRDNVDRLVREDLRDLSRIVELENAAALLTLLPGRVGSPLSVNSLRGDLNVSHETVRNYLRALKLCCILFEAPAYANKIARALKKERKVYFFDWARIDDAGARFENYVACELLSWTAFWSDSGLGDFKLAYVKTRNGQECDFLITKDGRPWLLLEAKLKSERFPSHLYRFSSELGGIPFAQLVREEGILDVGKNKDFRVSASRFLSG